MQTIETRYIGPTNTKPARIVATASGYSKTYPKMRLIVSADGINGSHKEAAYRLVQQLNWTGHWIGGDTKNGMVWVCVSVDSFLYS